MEKYHLFRKDGTSHLFRKDGTFPKSTIFSEKVVLFRLFSRWYDISEKSSFLVSNNLFVK